MHMMLSICERKSSCYWITSGTRDFGTCISEQSEWLTSFLLNVHIILIPGTHMPLTIHDLYHHHSP